MRIITLVPKNEEDKESCEEIEKIVNYKFVTDTINRLNLPVDIKNYREYWQIK